MIVVGKILNCIVERLRERDLFRIDATTLTECRGVSSILLPLFKMFLLGGYDCASKPGTDNGDKSKLNFLAIRHSCFATYLSRVIAREFHRLGRPGCPSNVIRYPAALFCGFAFVFRQSEICVICGLYGFRIRKAGRSNSRRN